MNNSEENRVIQTPQKINGRTIVFEPNSYGGRLKFYAQTASSTYWDDLWSSNPTEYHRSLKGHLPHQLRATFLRSVKPGARVLEAGCGLSHFTVACNVLGYQAEGLDWAKDTITLLQNKFPLIPFFVGDVRRLDTADNTYDAIYSPGVIEHFEEGPEKILSEMVRILKPGGIALISTPYFNSFLRSRAASFSKFQIGEFYQYAFSKEEITTKLEALGTRVIQVHPYGTSKTLTDHCWLSPLFVRIVGRGAGLLDYLPILRNWGHSCIWVARKL